MDKKKRNKHLTIINDLLHLLHKWILLLIACHCIVFFCPKKHFFGVCYLCAMQSKDTITENLWWPSHCCRRRLQNELTGSICRGSHLKVDPALQLQVCLTSDWNWNNTFRCEKSCVTHIKIAFPVQNSSPMSIA